MKSFVSDTGVARLANKLEAIRTFEQYELAVGILSDGKAGDDHGGITVLFIASIHEFGAPDAGIPARSFVRGYVDENGPKIRAVQAKLSRMALDGKISVPNALNQLGAFVAGGMQQRIADGIMPPLSPVTIEAKGSSTPLIDTGQLRSSITWLVRRKGQS